MPQSTTVPESVVTKDHELEGRTDRASEALAKLRWHWTIDNSNPDKVSFRTYHRAVGHGLGTIQRYARGYALYLERTAPGVPPRGSAFTIQDAIRLADQSQEMQQYSEAIAEGSGRPIAQVARGDNRHRTRQIIGQAQERATRRGTDPVDEAREIAQRQRQTRELEARHRTAARERHELRYVHIEGHLANAKRRLTEALREAEGVEFTDEEMELLRTTIANIRALLNLIDLRMAGSTDIDWDAEMTRLTAGDAS